MGGPPSWKVNEDSDGDSDAQADRSDRRLESGIDRALLPDDLPRVQQSRGRSEFPGDHPAKLELATLEQLHRAGAEFAAILANTPHNAYELIKGSSPLPIVTIMDATSAVLASGRRGKVALLGTRATMEYGFFQRHFESRGIGTLIPEAAQRRDLDRIIWRELSHGIVNTKSQAVAAGMVEDLVDRGAEAVVLACTELSLLMRPEDYSCPLYDTTELHAKAILEFAVKHFEP